MRWTIAAALSVAVLFTTTACQDQQARAENQRLQAELQAMKDKQSSNGNSELIAAMLTKNENSGGSADLERKLNSFGEDVSAGMSDIKDQIKESDKTTEDRMDKLEDRLEKVSELQTTIASLKGMIETLEGKVKNVDPNETLTVLKEKMQAEANLEVERKARESAEEKIAELKDQLETAQAEVERLNGEIATLQGDDITGHADYRALKAELRAAKSEVKTWESDYDNLNRKYQALLEQIGSDGDIPEDEPKELPENHDFSGKVTKVSKGSRPDGPSFLLVGEFKKGSVPGVGETLVVLDEKNERICDVKVIRLYHYNDNEDLPVEELGCETVNESPTNPVAKGDRVVWIKKEDDETGTSEDDEPSGAAGGD